MKRFLLVSIFLLTLLFISGCAESTSTQQTQQGVKPEVKTPQETTYAMNQNVNVDYLAYKVTKVETFREMGTSMFDKQTNGKFVKVYLEITNNAKETKQIFLPRFTLMDNQERQFDRLSDDMMYVADYLEFGEQLQPGLTTSGAIVFELPKDAADITLIISGDWTSISRIKIALSNIKDIGKDTTEKDKQDKMWDESMKEGQQKTKELMNKCNAPFSCSSSCPDMMDVGQKDCPSGKVCCMQ